MRHDGSGRQIPGAWWLEMLQKQETTILWWWNYFLLKFRRYAWIYTLYSTVTNVSLTQDTEFGKNLQLQRLLKKCTWERNHPSENRGHVWLMYCPIMRFLFLILSHKDIKKRQEFCLRRETNLNQHTRNQRDSIKYFFLRFNIGVEILCDENSVNVWTCGEIIMPTTTWKSVEGMMRWFPKQETNKKNMGVI